MLVKKHKKSLEKKTEKTAIKKGINKSIKKDVKKGTKKGTKKETKKSIKNIKKIKSDEKKSIQENIAIDVIEKVDTPQDTQINQDPILPMVRFGSLIPFASKRNYFTIISFLFILIFFLGGYIYPATSEDMASNNVIWAGNDGKYDRGLFNQFYASIAFTMGVFLLGYYVNATFIRFNIKDWNYFSIGILLMFFFGLGRVGELIFDHNIFQGFKNIVLPFALIVLAFALYKIYKNMAGGI